MKKGKIFSTLLFVFVALILCISITNEVFAAASILEKDSITGIMTTNASSNVSRFLAPIGAPDPYAIKIYTAQDLYNVRYNLKASYVLMNDIDLSWFNGGQWVPIGENYNLIYDHNNCFTGTFDGQGYVIRNLKMTGSYYRYSGLFGRLGDSAVIKNVGLEGTYIDVTVDYYSSAGGICGYGSNSITNCYNTGSIISYSASNSFAGGICGQQGYFSYCYNTGNIASATGGNNYTSYAGGICGDNGLVTDCYNTGNVSCHNSYSGIASAYAGGIIGYTNRRISYSYNTGAVSASSKSPHAGGITGYSNDRILVCYNTGAVSSFSPSADGYSGGICGYLGTSSGPISDCFNTGTVSSSGYSGGICGMSFSKNSISNCYNTGEVSASHASAPYDVGIVAGGICGYTVGTGQILNNVVLSNRIYAGNSSYPSNMASNLISGANSSSLKNNNLALTGIQGNATNDATRLISLAEARSQSTYVNLGWNFSSEWQMVPGYDYPQLKGLLYLGKEKPVITITTHPASNTTVSEGSITGSLSVAATVTQSGIAEYQWYSNTVQSNSGGNAISGATSSSYTIPTSLTATGSPYYYFCEVRATGATSVRSSVALVTVNNPFVPVTDITNVSTITTAGTPLALIGTVVPNNANNKTISWSVKNAGGTGAYFTNGNTLNTTSPGTAVVMATIVNGKAVDSDYTKDFTITVNGVTPTITTTALPAGTVGIPYSATLSANGTAPINWNILSGSLPGGLSLSMEGIISGTPTTTGTFSFTARAMNITGNDTKPLSIEIKPAVSTNSVMYLLPPILTTGRDRTFTVTYKVDSPQLYDNVQCVLNYDPNFLEFQDTASALPSNWMFVSNAEVRGRVVVGLGNVSGGVLSGDNSLATFTFKALAETPSTNILIIALPGYGAGSSKLMHYGVNIDFAAYGSAVNISNMATIKANYQGRAAGTIANVEELEIMWIRNGTVVAQESVTTDRYGEAKINIPSQNSDLSIRVKGERTLALSKLVGTVTTEIPIDVGTLSGGDANGDNTVDMSDFFIFSSNFGRSSDSTLFNELADFNNDGEVDMSDFFIFSSNFGRDGAPRPAGASMTSLAFINENINEEMSAGETKETDSGGCSAMPASVIVLSMLALALFAMLPRFRRR